MFRIDFDVNIGKDGRAELLYGVDDPRLMNSNLNIYNIASAPGESAIKFAFDYNGDLKIYRYGYHPDDSKETPLREITANECS